METHAGNPEKSFVTSDLAGCRPPHVFPATEEPEPGGYVMQAAKLLTLAREACEG